jgi:hypothetical protein
MARLPTFAPARLTCKGPVRLRKHLKHVRSSNVENAGVGVSIEIVANVWSDM